jgi:uncharacterized repeat protein (TIGR04052 family)
MTIAAVTTLTMLSCASNTEDAPKSIVLEFAPQVAGARFSCSESYSNIGTSKTTVKPLDFRMYITDVALLRADGTEVPVALEADGVWQRDRFALLDFEDGSGSCVGGTPAVNTSIRGKVPTGTYTGVAFTIGIPETENHLDAATAAAPLSSPGMWWSWSGGYKYIRLDVQTNKNSAYYLHLGATKCEGTVALGYTCAAGNRPRIKLTGLDPQKAKLSFDLADLWSEQDLDAQVDGMTDQVPGCMAFSGDPECPSIFRKLGLPLDGSAAPAQTFFKMVSR